MKLLYCIIFLLAISTSCKEAYDAPVNSPPTGYLVVEGFINNGTGPTRINLTRTTMLYDSVNIVYERNAQVTVEGDNNETYSLNEKYAGVYEVPQLYLNSATKYRVHIITSNGSEYASAYTAVSTTPEIDSISWERENDGVQLYINTHDPLNNTKYYQWKYEETWEIRSPYLSSLKYTYDSITGQPAGIEYLNPGHSVDTTTYKCWKTVNSTSILLGTTEKLSENRIYLPLLYIEPGSEKLSVLYSINVRQYALSQQAFQFMQKIKKNTEQLGSVFDPQPSELKGNIECLTNKGEIVIGFVEVTQEKQQRIFISNSEVPGWGYNSGCRLVLIDNHPDSILKYGVSLIPVTPATFQGLVIKDFYAAEERCLDCTLRGTNKKPAFWP